MSRGGVGIPKARAQSAVRGGSLVDEADEADRS